ncbi:sensor histidine kinase [Pedobacter ginsengisoli]|uniref:sensor histidine kinase n=1 Tax=Pedobacter ginsengisoli TaxID=363852 RepID=UPI00254CCEC6|nr:HAMP domain-containing sensor histidine kinase [Pedobacter ginsengisoli]
MKKRILWIITTLMTAALLGVFVMQLYYIREAYNLKSQLFEQNVNEALNDVASKVQKRYAANHITKKDYELRKERERAVRDKAQEIVDYKERFRAEEAQRKLRQQERIIADLNMRDSLIRVSFPMPKLIPEDVFQQITYINNKSESSMQVQVDYGVDQEGNIIDVNQTITANKTGTFPSKTSAYPQKTTIFSKKTTTFSLAPGKLPDSIRYLAYNPKNLTPITITMEQVTDKLARGFKREDQLAEQRYKLGLEALMEDTVVLENNSLNYLEDVAKEMRQASVPIEQRIPKDNLDTLIKRELLNRNINLDYDFWLKLATKDSLLYSQAAHQTADGGLGKNVYKIPLFGNDIFRDPGLLFISFPNKNSLILGNMWATMASSAGLLLVLVFIFAYTIYAIIRQKKISEMKTDFINNMTHEFKTPVATIMIASEALKDPEIVEDRKRISRLAGIIYDENVRLGNHIERVLSIARLEKKELKLEQEELNVNDLILVVTDSMDLQLQKKNAIVDLQLNAVNPVISGDELHFSNVIYNLIDNANKYSAGIPKITISTRNTARHLYIEIADEGIGMTRDQTRRIFDQFYRVPTGNLHDVKGFGLGLNYVQDIINQMGGTIKVNSEKDKGTKFEISLPLNQN